MEGLLSGFMEGAQAVNMLASNNLQQQAAMQQISLNNQLAPLQVESARLGIDQQKFQIALQPLLMQQKQLEVGGLGLSVATQGIQLQQAQDDLAFSRSILPLKEREAKEKAAAGHLANLNQIGQSLAAIQTGSAQNDALGSLNVQGMNLLQNAYGAIAGQARGASRAENPLIPVNGAKGTVYASSGDPYKDKNSAQGRGYANNTLFPNKTVALSADMEAFLASEGIPVHGAALEVVGKDGASRKVVVGDRTREDMTGRFDLYQGSNYDATDSFNGSEVAGVRVLAPGVSSKNSPQFGAVYNANAKALDAQDIDGALRNVVTDQQAKAVADSAVAMLDYIQQAGGIETLAKTQPQIALGMNDAISKMMHQPMVKKAIRGKQSENILNDWGTVVATNRDIPEAYMELMQMDVKAGHIATPEEFNAAMQNVRVKAASEAAKLKSNTLTPPDVASIQKSYNDLLQNDVVVKANYSAVASSNKFETLFGQSKANSKDAKAQGANDIALVNAYQQIIDPGAVVREGDVDLLRGAQSLAGQLTSWVNKRTEGEVLTQQQRDSMLRTVTALKGSYQGAIEERRGAVRDMSIGAGIPAQMVPFLYPASQQAALTPNQQAAGQQVPAAAPTTMKTVTFNGKQGPMPVTADGALVWGNATIKIGEQHIVNGKPYLWDGTQLIPK